MSVQVANSNLPNEQRVSIAGAALVETLDKFDIDDAGNSTTAILAANAQFSGVWKDASAYRSISIFQLSAQANATGGYKLQFSNDGSTIDFSWDITTTAGVPKLYKLPIYGKFFRVIYVNGGTAQTAMRINTRLSFAQADYTMAVAGLTVTATGAAGATATATLPAAGVGTYHYITSVIIQKFATIALTAGAAPTICATTNLNGFAPNTDTEALPIGRLVQSYQGVFDIPLKSQNANTATVFTQALHAGAIYKVIVTYFIGA